jgi:type I restriction enzyme S subunit
MSKINGLPVLPHGWVWTTFGQLQIDNSVGVEPRRTPDQTFELYSVPSFESGRPEIVSGREIGSNKQTVEEGAVLLCKINPRINRVWIVGNYSEHPKIASTEWIPFFAQEPINSKYLAYFMQNNFFRDYLAQNVSGVGGSLMRVKASTLADYPFPLAPRLEQQRIVAKIEELFTELDAGVETLNKALVQLKRYRQAVLKAAVTGELTREWRETHRDELEPAANLLARILRERRAKWEADQLTKMKATGKAPKSDTWKNKYKAANKPDIAQHSDLPEGWLWVSLGQLVWSVKDGPHYSPKYVEEGIPFITGGNVRPSGIDFASAKRINPELHEELSKRCKPEKGDVLYTKGGTTGIARVNTYDLEFNVWVHVAVLKLVDSVEPFYIQHALNSPDCYRQAQRFTHGVGNQDLGLTRMVNIIFALPSLAEQKEAVSEAERLLSIAEATERTIEQSLKQAERLRQSILQQAFAGKLVPQDPTDEPAEILLQRIKAERARNGGVSRKPRRAMRKQKQSAQPNLLP